MQQGGCKGLYRDSSSALLQSRLYPREELVFKGYIRGKSGLFRFLIDLGYFLLLLLFGGGMNSMAARTLGNFLGHELAVTLPESTPAVRSLQLWMSGEDWVLGLLCPPAPGGLGPASCPFWPSLLHPLTSLQTTRALWFFHCSVSGGHLLCSLLCPREVITSPEASVRTKQGCGGERAGMRG